MTDYCENCEKRPGETNSKIVDVGADGLGAWVCMQCEYRLEQDYHQAVKGGEIPRADMSNAGKRHAQADNEQNLVREWAR